MQRKISSLLVLLFICSVTLAQKNGGRNSVYDAYIQQYKDLAVEHMHTYKIPASITLAQGLLESGAGRSHLAVNGNNHFGIKCHSDWKGKRMYKDDDKKNDCFRVYSKASESYADHSKFLQRDRYKRLFALDPLDYKGWAHGLKACGYATDSKYAYRLIDLIERYELHQYDTDKRGKHAVKVEELPVVPVKHKLILLNDIACVVATGNETWEQIAKEYRISKKKLLKYNEVEDSYPLREGMHVFLKKKKTKAEKKYKGYWHKVKEDESMYTISQMYGIRVKYLYKKNFKDADYIPEEGDLLRVR